MSKNLIPKIAQMLGVAIGEEFLLRNTKTGFICSKDIYTFIVEDNCDEFNGKVRFKKKSDNGYQYHSSVYSTEIFKQLCEGKYEVVKLPWKPKKGEEYYTFIAKGADNPCLHVYCEKWNERLDDWAMFKAGWIYRTKEEVQAILPYVANLLGLKYEL